MSKQFAPEPYGGRYYCRARRQADIPDREARRCSWGKAAVVGVVSTRQVSRKPVEEYLPELD
jgi:hypothetical protein